MKPESQQHLSVQAAGGGGRLYVVATPIGNLGDITLRALEVLKRVARVAAEDTRVSAKLLAHYGIDKPLLAVHAHNERRAGAGLIAALARGEDIALITDAGTPAISDPGASIVAQARAAGFTVIPLPGPSAVTCALSASGLSDTQFRFCGFLPATTTARVRALEQLATETAPLVFYEAPHRIRAMLSDAIAVLGGGRAVTLARELTKLFEEIHTCALGDACDWLDAAPHREQGEFVVIVSGGLPDADGASAEQERVLALLLPELSLKQAVKLAAAITGGSRKHLYAQALARKEAALSCP